ncbi:MAG TPA: group 1 glycosyl transferase [Prolixibacteraceae bacterium]|nr:group 1 glycosyl transferase [Prolixibacteraceae bacterium]
MKNNIGVWFPAIRAETGADVFTIRLAKALQARGIHTQITWIPHHAEYLPWTVPVPEPPAWATVVHINSWLHKRFIPHHLPLIVTVHSCVHDSSLNPYKNFTLKLYHRIWIRRCETEAINRAEVVTAVSQYTKMQVERIFGCHDVIPIHNWIDTNVFAPRLVMCCHSPYRLLFVGSMRKMKGVDLLEKIMRNLGPDFELRFTCDPSDLDKLQPTIPSNMIALSRMNTKQELVTAYRNSDALLFPTRLEGFGLVALEAQACGIPVIATNCSSLPEVVEHGSTGLLCPKDDVQAFADAARELCNNSDKWNKMRHAARFRAQEMFNEEHILKKYIELYQNICSRFPRKGHQEN